MLTSDLPRTIDDAELHGWEALEIWCPTCRASTVLWFRMIRMRTRYRVLSEIKERLVCEKCKGKPRGVGLYRMVTMNDGRKRDSLTVPI